MHDSPDKVACQSRAKDGAVPCSVRVDLIACDTKLLEDDWFVSLHLRGLVVGDPLGAPSGRVGRLTPTSLQICQ